MPMTPSLPLKKNKFCKQIIKSDIQRVTFLVLQVDFIRMSL